MILDKINANIENETTARYYTSGKNSDLQKEWRVAKSRTKITFNVLQIITKHKKTPNYIQVRLQNFYHKHRIATKYVIG